MNAFLESRVPFCRLGFRAALSIAHSAIAHSAIAHSAIAHSATAHSATAHSATAHSAIVHSAIALLALVGTIFGPRCSFAEESRPKIGLVLAGGGALGFAHIGVLRVLERERIPVHYISGTSMGAIVGAAYASGCTLEELGKTLETVDWADLFNEAAPRAGLEYRLKPGRDRELVGDIKIGFKDGKLVLPRGAITGVKILPLFQKLFERAPSPADFDKLSIPYRAVAADIETGEEVVLSKGDLALAARASMSVPGAFEPVEIDGRLLVDGGIANNLPVELTRSLGADVLVVVELPASFKKRDELNSPLDISQQIISLLLAQNARQQLQKVTDRDVVIIPELGSYAATDFAKVQELIKIGEAAAEKMVPALRALSVPASEYDPYSARRTLRATGGEGTVEFVRLVNNSSVLDDNVSEALGISVGDAIDRKKFDESLRRVFELGYFADVKYSVVTEDGKKGVVYEMEEKRWFERFFRVGASMENDARGTSWNTIAVSYRDNSLFSRTAAAEATVEVGTAPRATGELLIPFTNRGATFFMPTVDLAQSPLILQRDKDPIARYQRRSATAGLFIGERLGVLGEAAIGYERGVGDVNKEIGDPSLPEQNYDLGFFTGKVTLDTLNDPDFPSSGYRFFLSPRVSSPDAGARYDFDFQQLTGLFTKPVALGEWTLLFRGDFGATKGDLPPELHYALGGFFDFSGYTKNSIVASDYGIGRLVLNRRLLTGDGKVFGMDAFMGGSLELGTFRRDIAQFPDDSRLVSGSVFTALDTPLIPLYLGVGFAEEGHRNLYVSIGRAFRPRRQ